MGQLPTTASDRVASVIIPCRNAAGVIGDLVHAVRSQAVPGVTLEVVVSDDGSTDETASESRKAGATVVRVEPAEGGNPAAARNRGAAAATGDPLIFLDADCRPVAGWLAALLDAHDRGAEIVGGALNKAPGLSLTARCDYYSGWYHMHSRRPGGTVVSHPPGNISVRRAVFARTRGFDDTPSVAYAHEELAWQAEARRAGSRITFEPRAVVHHANRAGLGNLLRRNYRWGYSAIESKAQTGAARLAGLYRYPLVLIVAGGPVAVLSAAYIVGCWIRAREFEPLLLFPVLLAAQSAWALGMTVGGIRWIRRGRRPDGAVRPLWE